MLSNGATITLTILLLGFLVGLLICSFNPEFAGAFRDLVYSIGRGIGACLGGVKELLCRVVKKVRDGLRGLCGGGGPPGEWSERAEVQEGQVVGGDSGTVVGGVRGGR